ncbi:Double zinc ribbon [Rhizobiales bacterium GAS191]|nr:Double zinc ribbon [Rhizobiales bacterium GAS191]
MECPQCRASVPDGKRFCSDCGSPLPLSCSSCGAAIAPGKKFCSDCGAPLSPLSRSADSTAPPQPLATRLSPAPPAAVSTSDTSPGAERRQLTVMFCDLVGSTAMAARMDPEDLREVIGAYHRCVAKAVTRFRGFVAKYMGDGVLVYFGYPHAHEDDAELAVRAGLKLMTKIAELHPRPEVALQVRVGIASGLVVVGDLIGSGASQEQAVVGETPNLAARLQALAEPNTVLIADSTHRLVKSLFEYRDLDTVSLKGFAEPVAAWEVVGASAYASRFEALQSGTLTPLVGREEEIDLLLRRWRQAKDGAGRVVLLSGEPGIGKSRITETLVERVAGEPHTRLRYSCSPHHSDSALYPIISQLERAARLDRDDSPIAKRDKLRALLSLASTSAEDAALITELLSLPIDMLPVPVAVTPQRRKQMMLEALVRQVEALARQEPVLIVFEDLHWIDATSLELLSLMVERARSVRVMLILTFRPEFVPPWVGQAHVTMLTLSRLDTRHAEAMVERLAGGRTLPPEVLDQIIARTDGVPLFVEELTKAVIDGGWLQREDERYVLTGPLPSAAIPTTLHASLVARFDRVAPVKDVAQIGAALGREFSFELVASLTGLSERALAQALEQLVSAELMYRRGAPPDAIYTFKHALVQDAAYATLLRGKRQELHARIADVLEAKFPETVETEPEILARHCTEASLTERAVAYWKQAGERAAKRSANVEAAAHLRRGLQLIEALPDRAEHADAELGLLISLGPVLMTTRSSAAPEVSRLYSKARLLAQGIGRSAELYATVWGSWIVAFVEGDLRSAARFVDDLFGIARDQGDPGLVLQAHHAAWPTAMVSGDLLAARRHVEAGLAIYDRDKHAHHAHLYGAHDAGVCGHSHQAWLVAVLGHLDQAVEEMDLALALSRDLGHPASLVHALWSAAELRHIRREPEVVEELTAALMPLVAEHGSAVAVANATMLRGWALVERGIVDEGVAELRKGLNQWRSTGSHYLLPYRLGRAAEAFRAAGLAEEGLSLVTEALGLIESSGDRWFEADLHRLQGELLPAARHEDRERSFHRALDVARTQSAKLLELRASASLARLWRDDGRRDDARALLMPAYQWFAEGFDTPDLKAAKMLIEELRL